MKTHITFHDKLNLYKANSRRSEKNFPDIIQRWRKALDPDDSNNSLLKRLAIEGLCESDLSAFFLLDSSSDSESFEISNELERIDRRAKRWAKITECSGFERFYIAAVSKRYVVTKDEDRLFVHAWLPAADIAIEELVGLCSKKNIDYVASTAWIDLYNNLLTRLSNIGSSALWSLYRERISVGACLLAQIRSREINAPPPPRERYEAFIRGIWTDGYLSIWETYPVLARHLVVQIRQWTDCAIEVLTRISADKQQIKQTFDVDEAVLLSRFIMDLGDQHHGGRSVCKLTFGKGSYAKQLIYKPRDIQIQEAYHKFLTLTKKVSEVHSLKMPKTLSRDGYGYIEWLQHHKCQSPNDLEIFYTGVGSLLAILYILGATDCHYENILAVGPSPVFIDAETLLEDGPLRSDQESNKLSELVDESVLRTSFLPMWMPIDSGRYAIDVSALNPQIDSNDPMRRSWIGINTDGMCMGYIKRVPTELKCSPFRNNNDSSLDFLETIISACKRTLQAIKGHKFLFVDQLAYFENLTRRKIIRSTRIYAQIREQLIEPRALKNWIEQGLVLEQLYRPYLHNIHNKHNTPQLIREEIAELQDLNIPCFSCETDLSIWDECSQGEQLLGKRTEGGLSAAKRRVWMLDEDVIRLQEELISGAFYAAGQQRRGDQETMSIGSRKVSYNEHNSNNHQSFVPSQADPDFVLCREAERLCELIWSRAVFDKNGNPDWLGMDLTRGSEPYRFGLMGSSLYGGQAGLGLVFAMMAYLCKKQLRLEESDCWAQRAALCLDRTIREVSEQTAFSLVYANQHSLGLSGLAGLLLVLQQIDRYQIPLLGKGFTSYFDVAEHIVSGMRYSMIEHDKRLDVLSGCAGMIGPLLRSASPNAFNLALQCGDVLLHEQHGTGGWTIRDDWPPLSGLSHGAAGIISAISVLSHRAPDERLKDAVSRALKYERELYIPAINNWPDLRFPTISQSEITAWCNGSPGIGLMRVALLKTCGPDEMIFREIEHSLVKIQSVLAEGYDKYSFDCICCGSFGLIPIQRAMIAALGRSQGSESRDWLMRRVDASRANGARYKFLRMGSSQLELYGLFTGLGGIAAVLLEELGVIKSLTLLMSAGLIDTADHQSAS